MHLLQPAGLDSSALIVNGLLVTGRYLMHSER